MSQQIAKRIFVCVCLLSSVTILSVGGVGMTSQAADDASSYIEVFDGDMPLMFAVGHGGWKTVGDLKNASEDFSNDPLLRDYFYRILAVRIYERTGHLPYVVYQQGKRNYVNVNRPVGHPEGYNADNEEARRAYLAFHDQVDAMIARIEDKYGADMALLINAHTGHLTFDLGHRPWDRIAEIGFIASVTNLGSDSNTMKALYDRRGEVALRGEDSVPYQLFHGQGWPTPDAVWPQAAITNSKTMAQTGQDVWHVLPAWVTGWNTDDWTTAYLNGYSTIMYHGSNVYGRHANWLHGLDAFQMEVNYLRESGISLRPTDPEFDPDGAYYQLDVSFTTDLMDDLIDAILHSLEVNYAWTPASDPYDVYNVVVDNGDPGFLVTGTWNESSGKGYWSTPSIYSDEAGATVTWTPTLTRTGTYEVFIRWTDIGERAHDAQYTVNDADGVHVFTVDQDDGRDARWVSLGLFRFEVGVSGNVVLTCTGSASSTSADAVLFRLVHRGNCYLPIITKL